jgi:hypothetical protein
MSLDLTTAAAVLKKTYADGIVELDYSRSKTLSLLKKKKGTLVSSPFGDSFNVPVQHGNPQAGSATYATGYAQASAEATRYKNWAVTPGTCFHFADVSGDIVRRGAGVGSFVDALTSEIENAKKALQRIMEIVLFRGGFGDLAQLSATAGVGTAAGVALAQPWMVRFIETGQSILFGAAVESGTLRGATPVKVTGRHAAAGTIDFAFAPNTAGTAAAVSDFLFRDGDRHDNATPTKRLPTGFKGWLPHAAPSSTAFFGVDRTVDDRLGGLRQDGALSGSIEEAFLDATTLVVAEGGNPSHFVTGPNTFNKLAKSMQNRIDYVEQETDVGIGIPGFRIKGQDAMVYFDNACEEGVSYGYNIEEVEIRYAGKDFVYLEEADGLPFRRVAGSDLWRSDLVACWNLIMPAPGHGVVITNL